MFRRARWMSLDGEWEFGAGESETFGRRIIVPFCPQSELSGLRDLDPGDVVWYRRSFDAPVAEHLVLHFGAVDYRATVWVNGEEVTRHEGGHTPFSVDITHVIRPSDNVLVVRAEDPLADKTIPRGKQHWTTTPEGIFYTATTGIWQTVWLEPLPARSIHSLHLVPDLDGGAIAFELEADGHVELLATFEGEVVGRWRGEPGSGLMALDEVRPWRPESPNLYGLRLTLDEVDQVDSYFGLRKVEARDGKFWLNNEPYVQRLVLDQGYFPGGLLTASSDQALRRDIELAKSMGFNGARKHQKIEDPRWLYWADSLGFLVWGEMANFHEWSPEAGSRLEAEWREAVLRDRNHPSIVAWTPMNESFGMQGVEPDRRAAFQMRLYQLTHELDGTRPVSSNDGWQHAMTDVCTLHDYAKADVLRERYRSLESTLDPKLRPEPPYLPGYEYRGEPILLSEFGGVKLAGAEGFGYSEAKGAAELLRTYGEMVEALMQPGPVEGFCYTQLTDVEQEQNGMLTFDRRPKVDPELLRRVTETLKQR